LPKSAKRFAYGPSQWGTIIDPQNDHFFGSKIIQHGGFAPEMNVSAMRNTTIQ
jgi:hypothetical protein